MHFFRVSLACINMKIEDVEDKELVFANDVVTKMCLNYPLCLVGRFLTNKTI